MSYSFETEDFIFSSSNPAKVDLVRRMFTEGGFTVNAIKNNEIKDRHPLMVNLTCWGFCNLSNSYWKARETRQDMHKDLVNSFDKYSSKRVFMKGSQGLAAISDDVLAVTGWRFD